MAVGGISVLVDVEVDVVSSGAAVEASVGEGWLPQDASSRNVPRISIMMIRPEGFSGDINPNWDLH